MKLTIRHIADKLGVHPATVSRALRNDSQISEFTRKKIKLLAGKLNYRPNLLAAGLITKKTFNIGLIVADITNFFFSQVARGVESTMWEAGYNVFTCNTDGKLHYEKLLLNAFISRGVDGIIIAPSCLKQKYIKSLLEFGIPVVFVDRCLPNLKASYVVLDNFEGSYQMTKYLLSLGHRRIAYIRVKLEMGRFSGYKKALQEQGIQIDNSLNPVCDATVEGGQKAVEKLLRVEPRPTAIFCVNDLVALGAMKVIKERGLKIPEDISLAGFDNSNFTEFLNPPLTTVHQPKYEMGQEAARILLNEINNKKSKKEKLIMKPALVIRESCKPLLNR